MFILHRGNIGDSGKGVGKKAFIKWYTGSKVEIINEEHNIDIAILLGSINSNNLFKNIFYFVKEVYEFKQEIKKVLLLGSLSITIA